MLSFHAPTFPDYLPLTEFLRERGSVAFLGATLASLSGADRPENAELLGALARSGVPMTFAIVDPEAPERVHGVLAEWLATSPAAVRCTLENSARFFRQLRREAGPYAERIVVRGLQVLPSSGVAMVDRDTPAMRARLTLYPMQGTPRLDPFLEGDRSTPDGRTLCDLCVNHFTRLVATSRDLSGDGHG